MKQWTEARLRSFVMSGLRRMTSRWGPKYSVLNKAFVEDQINALTENINQMRARVPFEFKKAPWAIPETLEVEFIEDEQE